VIPALLEPESPARLEERPLAEAPSAELERKPDSSPHDRLAVGMAYLLALTVVQRGIGLARNVLFCRWLDPEELGRWNLAFSFLMVAAPLAVLGLPGAFGRYAEHYRNRGHLRTFLRRTGTASLVLTIGAVTAFAFFPSRFAELVFRDVGQTRLMLLAAFCLASVIAFNFCTELFTALRRARVASTMQFSQGLIFTFTAVGLLALSAPGVESVLAAYGLGCVGACALACVALRETWRTAPAAGAALSHLDFWAKLLPFAGWIWATNLLTNLSDVADRYMILYFAGADAAAASALVGQYHSSRVAPELLASVAVMLSGVMLPYNTHDWEAGNRAAVAGRIRLAIKVMALVLTAAGAALLWLSGPLFGWVLDGKYAAGEAILPWTLLLCIYFGLSVLALNYLWCAERAAQAMQVMAASLVVNIALNVLLLPRFGLTGAVAATAASNGLALACAYAFNYRMGLRPTAGLWAASVAPLALLGGSLAATVIVGAATLLALRTNWLVSQDERRKLFVAIQGFWTRTATHRVSP
jgi:O-antigen/teichoic acid export membrane protein